MTSKTGQKPIAQQMPCPADTLRTVHARFDDMGTFSRASGWDLDFRQLSPGGIDIDLDYLDNSSISIMKVGFNRRIHQTGMAPGGMLTFGIPLTGNLDWYGGNTEKAGVMNFNHESGFDSVSTPGFQALTFSLSEEFIGSIADSLGLAVPDYFYRPSSGCVLRQSHAVNALRSLLFDLLNDRYWILDDDLKVQLVSGLLDVAMQSSSHGDKASLPVRSRAVFSAMEFIEDNCHDTVTVSNLCKNTGISIRTLNRAFNERFGVSPKVYINCRRLAGVNRALLAADSSQAISDIANEWGFWHMGQFARDYRILFGELPSDTRSRP